MFGCTQSDEPETLGMWSGEPQTGHIDVIASRPVDRLDSDIIGAVTTSYDLRFRLSRYASLPERGQREMVTMKERRP